MKIKFTKPPDDKGRLSTPIVKETRTVEFFNGNETRKISVSELDFLIVKYYIEIYKKKYEESQTIFSLKVNGANPNSYLEVFIKNTFKNIPDVNLQRREFDKSISFKYFNKQLFEINASLSQDALSILIKDIMLSKEKISRKVPPRPKTNNYYLKLSFDNNPKCLHTLMAYVRKKDIVGKTNIELFKIDLNQLYDIFQVAEYKQYLDRQQFLKDPENLGDLLDPLSDPDDIDTANNSTSNMFADAPPQTGGSKWHKFLHKHKGKGLTIKQLARKYKTVR